MQGTISHTNYTAQRKKQTLNVVVSYRMVLYHRRTSLSASKAGMPGTHGACGRVLRKMEQDINDIWIWWQFGRVTGSWQLAFFTEKGRSCILQRQDEAIYNMPLFSHFTV